MSGPRLSAIRRALLRWYRKHGRDLPWRHTKDPYAILVSEVMLQQTQVDRVTSRYKAFLGRFPTLRALAAASLGDVLRAWSGLGYNGRARRLWESAKATLGEGGRLPNDVERLRALPGIGRYTAAAVACFAFGARPAVVDVNVRRVLSRALRGVDDLGARRAWELAERTLPRRGAAAWTQALMDVGALFCRPVPKCESCPIRKACRGRQTVDRKDRPLRSPKAPFFGSTRFYRGQVIKALAQAPCLSFQTLGGQVKPEFQETDLPWLDGVLKALERDGLVVIDARRRRAALP